MGAVSTVNATVEAKTLFKIAGIDSDYHWHVGHETGIWVVLMTLLRMDRRILVQHVYPPTPQITDVTDALCASCYG